MIIDLFHYLILGIILFVLGITGIFLNRYNIISILISIQIILLGTILNFVSFSKFFQSIEGQVFTLFILITSIAEILIGLVFILLLCSKKRSIALE